jgi:hypothetical protein
MVLAKENRKMVLFTIALKKDKIAKEKVRTQST